MLTTRIGAVGLVLGCLWGCAPVSDEPSRSGAPDNPAQQEAEVEPSPRLQAGEQTEKPEAGRLQLELTTDDTALLRTRVSGGLGTCIETEGRWASHRVVVLHTDVVELHRKKRIATLRLLLDVIKSGTPKEALTAAGFADVLEGGEEGVLWALEWVDHSPARVDARDNDDQLTTRQIMVRDVERMIDKALGQPQAHR